MWRSLQKLGYKVVAIAVVADTDPELPENADVFYTINVGKVGKILQTLKQHDVKRNHDRQGYKRSAVQKRRHDSGSDYHPGAGILRTGRMIPS